MSPSPRPDPAHLTPAAGSRVALIATGGTIACTADAAGMLVPTRTGADLACGLEGEVEVIEFRQLDSSAITLADLDELRALVLRTVGRPEISGVVITHGTDSMEETALSLDIFVPRTKPVVLTGAQRPADDANADGPENLRAALALARAGRAGVFISFGGRTVPAFGARKRHTSSLQAFESLTQAPPRAFPLPSGGAVALADHPVGIIAAYPGAGADLLPSAGLPAGLIIEALGAGNVSPQLGEAIARAARAGTAVVLTTRTPYGEVSLRYGGAGGGASLARAGVVGAGALRAGQARILLAAALATGTPVPVAFGQ